MLALSLALHDPAPLATRTYPMYQKPSRAMAGSRAHAGKGKGKAVVRAVRAGSISPERDEHAVLGRGARRVESVIYACADSDVSDDEGEGDSEARVRLPTASTSADLPRTPISSWAAGRSPSARTPLFDSGDEEEEDDTDSYGFPCTPSSSSAGSWFDRGKGSSYGSPTSGRKSFTPIHARFDPLVSPPIALPALEPPESPSPSSNVHAPESPLEKEEEPRFSKRMHYANLGKSLLTQSLLALVQLPNLALSGTGSHVTTNDPKPVVTGVGVESSSWARSRSSIGLDDAFARTERWFEPFIKNQASEFGRLSPRAVDDFEASTTIVQLQTFSPPPRSSKQQPQLPPAPTPVAGVPRLVSNPKHLLQLAIELRLVANGKITAPLRPRAFIVRTDIRVGKSAGGQEGASRLRFEMVV